MSGPTSTTWVVPPKRNPSSTKRPRTSKHACDHFATQIAKLLNIMEAQQKELVDEDPQISNRGNPLWWASNERAQKESLAVYLTSMKKEDKRPFPRERKGGAVAMAASKRELKAARANAIFTKLAEETARINRVVNDLHTNTEGHLSESVILPEWLKDWLTDDRCEQVLDILTSFESDWLAARDVWLLECGIIGEQTKVHRVEESVYDRSTCGYEGVCTGTCGSEGTCTATKVTQSIIELSGVNDKDTLYRLGITGTSTAQVNPDEPDERKEMSVMLYRSTKLDDGTKGAWTLMNPQSLEQVGSDIRTLTKYARSAMDYRRKGTNKKNARLSNRAGSAGSTQSTNSGQA
ncbi:hypothetical protein QFC21_004576 [Naganishia friedmannii]|uniref:Uncharacterized protein n=1 Tax=Naganishia friedmannii TaxID=89922 RepID=A0ACC2VH33_9TREE|nr:hypothetical protein QFC21_004576 [Naganishia friedmannii]